MSKNNQKADQGHAVWIGNREAGGKRQKTEVRTHASQKKTPLSFAQKATL